MNRIAAILAPVLTSGDIDEIAKGHGIRKLDPSNKPNKIRQLLAALLEHRAAYLKAESAVANMVNQAHHRSISNAPLARPELYLEDVDDVVEEMRNLDLRPGEVARKTWRKGLKPRPVVPSQSPPAPPAPGAASTPGSPKARPQRHEHALVRFNELARDRSNEQARGREFEKVLAGVLRDEDLLSRHNIVNQGEQIDLSFVLDSHYYLVECRWAGRQGAPAVREASEKFRRHPEGTFGVLVSIDGFTSDVNQTAIAGARLNCLGLTHAEVLPILEGRTTWAATVRAAREMAVTKNVFYVSLVSHQ